MAAKSKVKPVIISPQAQKDIKNILSYLEENWTQTVIDNFLLKLKTFYTIVSINPQVFGYYDKRRGIRNYAITRQNVIYYRNKRNVVEIITVFDSRQHPKKLRKVLK
jgi:plasmid stabilization system protein ParE